MDIDKFCNNDSCEAIVDSDNDDQEYFELNFTYKWMSGQAEDTPVEKCVY